MRTALPLALLLLGTACNQGTLYVQTGPTDGVDTPAESRWVVESDVDDSRAPISELGWAWDFGEFMAITGVQDDFLNYEWSMTRDADGRWTVRDDLLMYYARGPGDMGDERMVGNAWFHLDEFGVYGQEPDSFLVGYAGPFRDLWADGEQLWAVGEGGRAVHFDGLSWTEWDTGTDQDLHSVEGGPSGIWAVGDNGTIVHFDGEAWWVEDSGVSHDLSAVEVIGELDMLGQEWAWNERHPQDVGVALGDVFAGGPGGLILRRE